MEEWAGSNENEQGSPAWIAAKRRRIGGGSIGSVMGISPYKTRRQLWEEMTGRAEVKDIGNLPHVRRGVDAEPVARALLETRRGVVYDRPVLIHALHPWAVASVDGQCSRHLLEIKTGSEKQHELLKMAGVVPPHYEMQCQWAIMIAASMGMQLNCLYADYRPETGEIAETWITPRAGDEMLERAQEFMRWVDSDTPPPDAWKGKA